VVNRLVSVGDDSFLPSTIRVAEINLPAGMGSGAISGKVEKGSQVFSVLDDGAVADATDAGGTDCTAAFQATMDKAWGNGRGGTMLIPPGAYKLTGYVRVRSNVRILGYGAVIRKYSGNTTYSSFQALSAGAQGYGSSATNVLFEGLSFRGKFGSSSSGNAVTLHHAQGVTFRKCTWTEAVLTGHAIDLMGCDGVLVDDCSFKGFSPQADREYVEAIQVDYSNAASGGSDTTASFDGLPSINVTVQNSRFTRLTISGVPYPAPNPIGSHTRVAGRWLDTIVFDNNYVEGCAANLAVSGFSVTNQGWIHFLCARNVAITRNTFVNVGAIQTKVVYFNTISTGTALADVQDPNAASTSMTVMPVDGFVFDGNTLVGFANDTMENLVEVRGTQTVNATNIRIGKNTLKDSYSTPGVTGDKGSTFVYLQDVTGVTLDDNYLNNARELVNAYRVKKIKIRGGELLNLGAYMGRFNECIGVKIRDVDIDSHGGGWWFYGATTGISVSGGSILNGRADALRKKHFSISGALEWTVRDVRMPKDGNAYTSAIDAYSTSTKGIVTENQALGWDAGTFLSLGAGSTTTAYDRNAY